MAARSISWKVATAVAVAGAASVLAPVGASPATAKKTVVIDVGSTISSTLWGDDDTKEGKQASRGNSAKIGMTATS